MSGLWSHPSEAEEERARAWAAGVLGTIPAGPRYGTAAWLSLDDGDPVKWRECVLAADCWREHWSRPVMAARVRADYEGERLRTAQRWRQASYDVAGTRVVDLGIAAITLRERRAGR